MVAVLQEEMISPNPNLLSRDCRQNGFKELPVKMMGRLCGSVNHQHFTHWCTGTVTPKSGQTATSTCSWERRQEGDSPLHGRDQEDTEVSAGGKKALQMNTVIISPKEGNGKAMLLGSVTNTPGEERRPSSKPALALGWTVLGSPHYNPGDPS